MSGVKRLMKTNHKKKASYFYTWLIQSQFVRVREESKGTPERVVVNQYELVSFKSQGAEQGKGEINKNINLKISQALKMNI